MIILFSYIFSSVKRGLDIIFAERNEAESF